MKKWKEKRSMGPNNINWWKCKDEMVVEYRERVRRKYDELDADTGTVEGEWRKYKDSYVGGGGGAVWQNVGDRRYTEKQKPRMVDGRGGEDSGREAGSMDDDGMHYSQREQPATSLKHLYGQKKKAAMRAVDRARRSMEEELYRKLDEDGGKRVIFKMARDITEEGRDVKRGAVIKDNNGRCITERKEVLRIWAANFKELLNG